jgi:hypothetical protein
MKFEEKRIIDVIRGMRDAMRTRKYWCRPSGLGWCIRALMSRVR